MTIDQPTEQCANPPNVGEITRFLRSLLSDGRLTLTDIEILRAHARLNNRTGTNGQIADAASTGIRQLCREQLTSQVLRRIPEGDQPPSWHTVDCLQRWLGHALAQEFAFFRLQVSQRTDKTRRWWLALAEEVEVVEGKCIEAQLRREIAEAIDLL